MGKDTVSINIRFPSEAKCKIDQAIAIINKKSGPARTSLNSFIVWVAEQKADEILSQEKNS